MPLSWHISVSTNPRNSPDSLFKSFCGGCITQTGWLNPVNLLSSPSPPQRPSGGLTEGHFIGITKTFLSFRKFQGVSKLLCQEWVQRPNMYFIILHYCFSSLLHAQDTESSLFQSIESFSEVSRILRWSSVFPLSGVLFNIHTLPECGQDLGTWWDFTPVMRLCYMAKVKGFCRCKWGPSSVDFELIKGRLSWGVWQNQAYP